MRAPLTVVLVLFALAGCSSAPSNYFVLTPQPGTTRATPQQLTGTTTLAIGAVRLPGALDRPQIARRIGPNQLEYAETERWAGPLDEMIRRVLSADLRSRLPPAVVIIDNSSTAPANLTIAVDIARFEAGKTGQVTLEASWEKLGLNAAVLGVPGYASIAEPGSGSAAAAVAATMSRALAALADRIAANLEPRA